MLTMTKEEERKFNDRDWLDYFARLVDRAKLIPGLEFSEESKWILEVYDRYEEALDLAEKREQEILECRYTIDYLEQRYEPLN